MQMELTIDGYRGPENLFAGPKELCDFSRSA